MTNYYKNHAYFSCSNIEFYRKKRYNNSSNIMINESMIN